MASVGGRLWGLVLLLLCAACGSARYRPQAPLEHRLSVGTARPVQVTQDANEGGGDVTVELELEPGTRLLRVGQPTPEHRRGPGKPCLLSPSPLQVIDGVSRYRVEPPELAGRHRLTLNQDAAALDPLGIETEGRGARHCDELQLKWPEAWQREPFWFGDVRLGATAVVPRLGIVGLRLLVARWTGRVRLGAELGLINGLTCDDSRGDCKAPFALPVGVEVGTSRRGGDSVFLVLGGRLGTILSETGASKTFGPRAFLLQGTAEVLVGNDLRRGIDDAPAGSTVGLGIDAGPAYVLGADAGLGLALGFHLSCTRTRYEPGAVLLLVGLRGASRLSLRHLRPHDTAQRLRR